MYIIRYIYILQGFWANHKAKENNPQDYPHNQLQVGGVPETISITDYLEALRTH